MSKVPYTWKTLHKNRKMLTFTDSRSKSQFLSIFRFVIPILSGALTYYWEIRLYWILFTKIDKYQIIVHQILAQVLKEFIMARRSYLSLGCQNLIFVKAKMWSSFFAEHRQNTLSKRLYQIFKENGFSI